MLKSNLWLMLMVQLLAGLLFAYLALLPLQTGGPPAGWIAAFAVCFTGVMIGYIVYMMKLQREPDDEPDNTPDSAWKWGGFLYYNREDPALMVEKRIGLGYTLNFGNSASWVFIGLVTLLTALPLYVFR